MDTKEIKICNINIGGGNPLAFIAGPCVIENKEATLAIARELRKISEDQNISLIFKSSYDKANRTSVKSFRGPGIKEGLEILGEVKKETGLPVISDVHTVEEAKRAGTVLDVLQIPAFLCRQTDIIAAAAETGRPVNIKKGQFLAPHDAKNILDKAASSGNKDIMITERGVSFGYNNLIVDMRSIPVLKSYGYPVIYDATHSVQLPGGKGVSSGGQREFIEPLSRAAVSVGCDAIFMEVHNDPDSAPCDGPNMLRLEDFTSLARRLIQLNHLVRGWE
jgi:2-dehydro-3-deoxyphosphooctonate aldolase (KDO 8-P synthase)